MVLPMKRAEVVRDYGGISATERRAERRRKLVAAGRQIWGESGANEVTVRGVCIAAGLIPRYFYEQFPNREALLFAVSDEVRAELLETLEAAGIGDPGTLHDKLRSAVTAFLAMLAADPQIHHIAAGDVSGIEGLPEHRTQLLEKITELVIRHTPGILGDTTPEPTELRHGAQFIVGGMTYLIETWLANPQEETAHVASVCAALSVAVVQALPPQGSEYRI